LFTRDVANVVMDSNEMEAITFNALGGADNVVINDMSGTDLTEVNIHLAGANGLGDGQADTIFINATNGDDVVLAFGDGSGVSVFGLAAVINITGFEANLDRIVINGFAGDDVIEASGLAAGAIQLTADGGDDDDVLVGGANADILLGGLGDDVLVGGPAIDILDGGLGSNILIQD
jgi:Ca2+-binding RTX toxin-like protein